MMDAIAGRVMPLIEADVRHHLPDVLATMVMGYDAPASWAVSGLDTAVREWAARRGVWVPDGFLVYVGGKPRPSILSLNRIDPHGGIITSVLVDGVIFTTHVDPRPPWYPPPPKDWSLFSLIATDSPSDGRLMDENVDIITFTPRPLDPLRFKNTDREFGLRYRRADITLAPHRR